MKNGEKMSFLHCVSMLWNTITPHCTLSDYQPWFTPKNDIDDCDIYLMRATGIVLNIL